MSSYWYPLWKHQYSSTTRKLIVDSSQSRTHIQWNYRILSTIFYSVIGEIRCPLLSWISISKINYNGCSWQQYHVGASGFWSIWTGSRWALAFLVNILRRSFRLKEMQNDLFASCRNLTKLTWNWANKTQLNYSTLSYCEAKCVSLKLVRYCCVNALYLDEVAKHNPSFCNKTSIKCNLIDWVLNVSRVNKYL